MAATTESFLSGGTPVPTEVFEPQSTGKHRAVLILHGTFGLLPQFRADIVSFAEALVANDIAATIPHYFEATDTKPGLSVLQRENMAKLPIWKKTCADAYAFMAADGRFEADHLGAIGFSLGGNLALNLAMAPPPGTTVQCVVDFFGPTRLVPLDDKFARLPLVLIQHGTADTLVPTAESDHLARELERVGKSKDRDYFLELYEGEGHGFKEPALTRSRNRTLEFVDKTL
jgi:dienelactone hydrolase